MRGAVCGRHRHCSFPRRTAFRVFTDGVSARGRRTAPPVGFVVVDDISWRPIRCRIIGVRAEWGSLVRRNAFILLGVQRLLCPPAQTSAVTALGWVRSSGGHSNARARRSTRRKRNDVTRGKKKERMVQKHYWTASVVVNDRQRLPGTVPTAATRALAKSAASFHTFLRRVNEVFGNSLQAGRRCKPHVPPSGRSCRCRRRRRPPNTVGASSLSHHSHHENSARAGDTM